jgi:hypothetical protein
MNLSQCVNWRSRNDVMGHFRPIDYVCAMSAYPPKATDCCAPARVAEGPLGDMHSTHRKSGGAKGCSIGLQSCRVTAKLGFQP